MTPPTVGRGRRQARLTVNVAPLLGAENLFVAPGESATCQLSLAQHQHHRRAVHPPGARRGHGVDGRRSRRWCRCSPAAQQTVTLRFSPPRLPTTPSGEVPFAVKVIPSIEPEESMTEEGVIIGRVVQRRRRRTGAPSHDRPGHRPPEAGGRQPRQRPGAGRGHRPRRRRCPEVQDAAPRLTTAPGEARFVKVGVKPRQRFWKGPPQQKPYKVQVAAEHEDPLVLDGALTQKAVLPKWVYYAALIAAALLLLWFFVLKPVVHSTAVNANKQALAVQAARTKALPEPAGGHPVDGRGQLGRTTPPMPRPCPPSTRSCTSPPRPARPSRRRPPPRSRWSG